MKRKYFLLPTLMLLIFSFHFVIPYVYENINNIDCNEENSYYDYITNQLKNILKDYQINSYDDLKTLLSDNNIKKLIELIK